MNTILKQKGTVIENRVMTVYGRLVLRILSDQPSKKKTHTILIYVFTNGKNLEQVTYSADKDIFNTFAETFQSSIIGALKSLQ